MSLGIFLALCIVGADFLLYFLFQWMYGEKRAKLAKKVAAQRRAMELERQQAQKQQAGPFLVHPGKGGAVTQERMRKIRERMRREAPTERQLA
jgi:hypothetical protein